MKFKAFTFTLAALGLGLVSCNSDNYDTYTEQAIDQAPVEVVVDDAISFGLRNSESQTNTAGIAYVSNDFYHVGSKDVVVTCIEGGGINYSFDGQGDYFSFGFYAIDGIPSYVFGGFETEIDGNPTSVIDVIYPDHCPEGERLTVDFQRTDERIWGRFTGEFYRYADSLVTPFDSCVNYVSLGILEAEFDVELIICD